MSLNYVDHLAATCKDHDEIREKLREKYEPRRCSQLMRYLKSMPSASSSRDPKHSVLPPDGAWPLAGWLAVFEAMPLEAEDFVYEDVLSAVMALPVGAWALAGWPRTKKAFEDMLDTTSAKEAAELLRRTSVFHNQTIFDQ